ncbi:hypothetical protein ACWGH3_10675 [Streptomyces sp. NPDC054884]|uniref:hypothetical protein n=1 Tax=unclassified Streptomyces TaxID=2593676 RepID=UPI0029B0C373|nr:hypothetical protein [Streptomyces sp. ME08-AFT2]MDX3309470.1 hypothetical protein [Streptomyces sp. ME08-AFT2]
MRAACRTNSVLFETRVLELQLGGVLSDGTYLLFRESVGSACGDLDTDLERDAVGGFEVRQDLLLDIGEVGSGTVGLRALTPQNLRMTFFAGGVEG